MPITVDDLMHNPFSNRTREDKIRIVAEGKPRPLLNMAAVITVNNESSSGQLLTQQFDPGMYDDVQWLTGCEKRQTFFCWPCLLFKPPTAIWNSTGVSDLAYLIEGMSKHEESFDHVEATLQLKKMIESVTASEGSDVVDTCQYNEIVKRNRDILKRLTDVVCNLLVKERPHYERKSGCQLNADNCVKNLQFLRSYDVLNCNFVEDAIDLIKISPGIVNDLVDTIAKIVKMAVRKEVLASTYVSLILSDHTKIGKKSQISTVLRYLKEGKVCEKFIGFMNTGDQRTFSRVYQHITHTVAEFGLSERLLSVSLDGGLLPVTDLIQLNAAMKSTYPYTFFVPWYCHGVESVLLQSLRNIKECSVFLKAMSEMKSYFSKKSRRYKALENFILFNIPSTKNTKWFVRSQFIQVVNKYRKYFILFFESMLQNSGTWEADDVTKALGFQQILEEFQTVFLLQAFTRLFTFVAPLNKALKSSSPEAVFGCNIAEELKASLVSERDRGFEEIWTLVHSEKCLELPGPASKKIKTDSDDPKIPRYRDLYHSIIDYMIQEIEIRFSNLTKLHFCNLLICDSSGSFIFNNDMLLTLVTEHGPYFDEEQIRNELIVLRTNGKVFSKKSVRDLLDFFAESKLKNCFKYVYKLSELILTLPINRHSEEASTKVFKLEEIKDWSYVPEVLGVQTGDVGIPCVEIDYLQELKKSSSFYDEVAEVFYETNKTFELMPK